MGNVAFVDEFRNDGLENTYTNNNTNEDANYPDFRNASFSDDRLFNDTPLNTRYSFDDEDRLLRLQYGNPEDIVANDEAYQNPEFDHEGDPYETGYYDGLPYNPEEDDDHGNLARLNGGGFAMLRGRNNRLRDAMQLDPHGPNRNQYLDVDAGAEYDEYGREQAELGVSHYGVLTDSQLNGLPGRQQPFGYEGYQDLTRFHTPLLPKRTLKQVTDVYSAFDADTIQQYVPNPSNVLYVSSNILPQHPIANEQSLIRRADFVAGATDCSMDRDSVWANSEARLGTNVNTSGAYHLPGVQMFDHLSTDSRRDLDTLLPPENSIIQQSVFTHSAHTNDVFDNQIPTSNQEDLGLILGDAMAAAPRHTLENAIPGTLYNGGRVDAKEYAQNTTTQKDTFTLAHARTEHLDQRDRSFHFFTPENHRETSVREETVLDSNRGVVQPQTGARNDAMDALSQHRTRLLETQRDAFTVNPYNPGGFRRFG